MKTTHSKTKIGTMLAIFISFCPAFSVIAQEESSAVTEGETVPSAEEGTPPQDVGSEPQAIESGSASEEGAAQGAPQAEPTPATGAVAGEQEGAPSSGGEGVPSPPTNVEASDRCRGIDCDDMVIVTWEGDGDYYRVYRSDSRDGPWEQLGSNVTGTEYRDYDVHRDDVYYYRVQAFVVRGPESEMSEVDAGRADLSTREFLDEVLRTERNAHRKLRLVEPEPGIGTDVTVRGERGGTARWTIERSFLEGEMTFAFRNYNDFGVVMNGSTGGDISIFKNGENDGTVEISGDYEGTVIWNVDIRDGDGAGGGFMVIYPTATRPVWVPWASLDLEPLPEITPREDDLQE